MGADVGGVEQTMMSALETLLDDLKILRDVYKKDKGSVSCETVARQLTDTIREHTPPHDHTCQQCDTTVLVDCDCETPVKNVWCSARCKAAYDL